MPPIVVLRCNVFITRQKNFCFYLSRCESTSLIVLLPRRSVHSVTTAASALGPWVSRDDRTKSFYTRSSCIGNTVTLLDL